MAKIPLMPFEEVADLSLRQAALVYARAGFAVFPCWPGTKEPATTHSFHEASSDLEQVSYWWRRDPEANIGLATGRRVDVLDVDVHSTGTGFASLQRILDAGFGREWAHAVRSPSGGLHLYYPVDPDREQRNWSRRRAHVDFRGAGGYIMAPPSRVRVDGQDRSYEPVGPAFAGRAVQAEQIRELLAPPPTVRITPLPSADASLEEHAERIGWWLARAEGSDRNEALFWAACRLVELGASEDETWAYLAEPSDRIGLSQRETIATIRNAYRFAIPDLIPMTGSGASRHPARQGLP